MDLAGIQSKADHPQSPRFAPAINTCCLPKFYLHLLSAHSTNHCWVAVNQAGWLTGDMCSLHHPQGHWGQGCSLHRCLRAPGRRLPHTQAGGSELSTPWHQTPCKVPGEGPLPALALVRGEGEPAG